MRLRSSKIETLLLKTLLIGLLVGSATSLAQVPAVNEAKEYFLDSPQASKYAVILTGPTIGETNKNQFRQWAFSLHDILARDYGYTSESITLLYDRGETASIRDERIDGACDLQGIEQGLAQLAGRVKTGDQITLYLIGHGSGAEEEAKFNIVGPDVTGAQFAELLDQFNEQDIASVSYTHLTLPTKA